MLPDSGPGTREGAEDNPHAFSVFQEPTQNSMTQNEGQPVCSGAMAHSPGRVLNRLLVCCCDKWFEE